MCLGKLRTEGGFARVVAIKALFPQYARDPEFVKMFLDEARLTARVRHPNVAGTLDVVADDGELFLVMEYVAGETLARLLSAAVAKSEPIEPAIAAAIVTGLLEGLHAAHTATDPSGGALNIVHRDVSPQNLLVGVDGVPRVVDFGVAKAIGRLQTTDDGQLKGKILYMPPEQMRSGGGVDRRADLWAAGAVLWEMLAGRRPFHEISDALAYHSNKTEIVAPGEIAKRSTPLDAVVLRAMAREPDDRFPTAREMIVAIEKAVPPAPARRVAQWVARLAEGALARRQALVTALEAYEPSTPSTTSAPAVVPARVEEPPPKRRLVVPVIAAVAVVSAAAILGLQMRARGNGVATASPSAPVAESSDAGAATLSAANGATADAGAPSASSTSAASGAASAASATGSAAAANESDAPGAKKPPTGRVGTRPAAPPRKPSTPASTTNTPTPPTPATNAPVSPPAAPAHAPAGDPLELDRRK